MAFVRTFVRPDKIKGIHTHGKRLTRKPSFECLEARTLMATALPETLSVVASDIPTAELSVVETTDSRSMAIEYGTGVYVGQIDSGNAGSAADDLAGSFAWHEAYEDLQAVREIQRLAELRHAFEGPLGGDANAWSLGNEPGQDHGDLLDLPESPTDAGPGLPLGWGEGDGDGDPRDPRSMFPSAPEGPAPGESGGLAGALERVGWVSTKEGSEPPSVILAEERSHQPDGSSTRAVAREYEDGTLEVVVSRKSADGTHSTTRIILSPDHSEYHYESEGSDGSYVGYDEARYYSPDEGVWIEWHLSTMVPGAERPLHRYRSGPLPAPRDERPDSEDPAWFSPLHPDAWATFLAWWTHRTGPSIGLPVDDFDTGPDDGSSSGGGSAAPRVGIEAVINPGDSSWSPSVPGASGGDGAINRPDDPFPPPPASK